MLTGRKVQIIGATLAILLLFSIPLYAEVKIAVLDSGCATSVYYKAKSFTSLNVNQDPISHGTRICRIIKDNAPSAKIYFAQVCDSSSKPKPQAIVKAIKWCMEEGVDVANLSLTIKYDSEVEAAIKEAYLTKGIIFVVASGNKKFTDQFASRDGFVYLNHQEQRANHFPASSEFVISVGALDRAGRLAAYSDGEADIAARGDGYGLEGTSVATAYASAKICQLLPQIARKSLPDLKAALQR